MSKILLDTNAYTKYHSTPDDSIIKIVQEAEIVFLPVVVLGELLFGFRRGRKEIANRELLNRFFEKPVVEVVSIHNETADIYADVLLNLTRKGTPIPANDVWIAASAIEHGAVLVTYDTHFLAIPGLRLWDRLKIKN